MLYEIKFRPQIIDAKQIFLLRRVSLVSKNAFHLLSSMHSRDTEKASKEHAIKADSTLMEVHWYSNSQPLKFF